ncbi:MAG: polysaccharide biosynthesis/export family protein [Pseudomonadota bacterium]
MRVLIVVLALCALTIGCALAPATAPPTIPFDRDQYRLGIGDRIRIDVYGENELSLEAQLEGSGLINYPLLGRIQAKGATAPELEKTLATLLSRGYLVDPKVRINIVHYRPIYIYGQVRKTGAYPYSEGLTIEKVMVLAGGLTPIGSLSKIFLVREGFAPDQRERVLLETPVFPGDTIYFDESLF